jgi:hypothetical protein
MEAKQQPQYLQSADEHYPDKATLHNMLGVFFFGKDLCGILSKLALPCTMDILLHCTKE